MTAAVLAALAVAVILIDAHRRRRRQRRERRARLDEQFALIRADHQRAVGERDSLAVQTASLRRRIDVLERDAADWKAIAEGWMRRAVDLRTAPQPAAVVDELRQRRDDRGRYAKPAAEAQAEAVR